MKKLFTLLSIFAIVLSCSSDETSTPFTPPPAPIAKYTITLSAGEGGTVSTTGGEYEAGQTVSVTATSQAEYLFKDWSDGNTDATRTITVSSNSTLTANFEKKKYPLTVNIEGEGEVLEEIVNAGRTTDYDSGTTVKLTAVPADCWSLNQWTGDFQSEEIIIEINVNSPKTINVSFNEIDQRPVPVFSNTSYFTRTYYNRSFNNYLNNSEDWYNDPLDAVVLDYDMDGYLDFVYTNSDYGASFKGVSVRNKIKFYRGNCNGDLELDEVLSNKFNGLEHGRKGLVGDYNNDGYPDIFFVGHGIDTDPFPGEYPILLTNIGGNDFEENRFEDFIGFWHSAASGDYDNDGDLDIILISQSKTYIMKNTNGEFEIIADNINYDQRAIKDFPQESIVPIINQVYTSELYDLDKDGFLDLVVSGHDYPDQYGGESLVLFGDGKSFLKDKKIIPSVEGFGICIDIDFLDINNDGETEIILNRTGDPKDGLGFYRGWKVQILELINGEYLDSTDKYIDISQGSDSDWMYWLHLNDNNGIIELFNDDLHTTTSQSKPYRKWELINSKFILQ